MYLLLALVDILRPAQSTQCFFSNCPSTEGRVDADAQAKTFVHESAFSRHRQTDKITHGNEWRSAHTLYSSSTLALK